MQVPVEDHEFDPDGPPCAPYPGSVLVLGGYRWLGMGGRVLTVPADKQALADDLAATAIDFGDDPQKAVGSLYGTAVDLNNRTLAFWEAAAQRGGYVLSDLIV